LSSRPALEALELVELARLALLSKKVLAAAGFHLPAGGQND
jgi:hypothetical protein